MPSKHLRIGITGGIGAGKSIVCRVFKILGIPVYDADSRAKWLMNADGKLVAAIKDLFGEEAYQDGKLNRKHLSRVAFGQEEILEKLNSLVHPRVGEDYDKWVKEHQDAAYSLKEAALLFESGSYKALDHVILVTAPEDIRIQRVLKRDPHRSAEDVRKIIARQWSEPEKLRLSDFVLKNDGSEPVIPRVLKIHSLLLGEVRR